MAHPDRSPLATGGTSADVGGSWRIGIGLSPLSIKKRLIYQEGSWCRNDRHRYPLGKHSSLRGDAADAAGHRLHAVTVPAARTSVTALLGHRRHVRSHCHCHRHIGRLNSGQAHTHVDEQRKQEGNKLSKRPNSHDNAQDATFHAPWQIEMPRIRRSCSRNSRPIVAAPGRRACVASPVPAKPSPASQSVRRRLEQDSTHPEVKCLDGRSRRFPPSHRPPAAPLQMPISHHISRAAIRKRPLKPVAKVLNFARALTSTASIFLLSAHVLKNHAVCAGSAGAGLVAAAHKALQAQLEGFQLAQLHLHFV